MFNDSVKPHQEALEKSGYAYKLQYEPPANNPNKKRNRSRKVTWFNPPFSLSVKTKIGKEFLRILDKSFPQNNPLHKLFNRNTVKISYKCMPSMAQAVSRHNTRLARQDQAELQPARSCNCSGQDLCPVNGQCLKGPVVYRAAVTSDNRTEYYTGIAGNNFKERVNRHNYDIRHSTERHATTLANHIWDLKDMGSEYELDWSLIDKAPIFNHTTGKCRLCLKEKWYIMFRPEGATVNSRSEFYSTCRHRLKNLLCKVKS